MNDLTSPATRLHDVVVIHEQSGAMWNAGRAAIRGGRIVVPAGKAPASFFDYPAATFRIEAVDAANRVRRFPNVALADRNAEEYVFD
jgi:hypothetical protein